MGVPSLVLLGHALAPSNRCAFLFLDNVAALSCLRHSPDHTPSAPSTALPYMPMARGPLCTCEPHRLLPTWSHTPLSTSVSFPSESGRAWARHQGASENGCIGSVLHISGPKANQSPAAAQSVTEMAHLVLDKRSVSLCAPVSFPGATAVAFPGRQTL